MKLMRDYNGRHIPDEVFQSCMLPACRPGLLPSKNILLSGRFCCRILARWPTRILRMASSKSPRPTVSRVFVALEDIPGGDNDAWIDGFLEVADCASSDSATVIGSRGDSALRVGSAAWTSRDALRSADANEVIRAKNSSDLPFSTASVDSPK